MPEIISRTYTIFVFELGHVQRTLDRTIHVMPENDASVGFGFKMITNGNWLIISVDYGLDKLPVL